MDFRFHELKLGAIYKKLFKSLKFQIPKKKSASSHLLGENLVMKILGKEIKTGKRNQLKLYVASLYTRTKLEIPIIIERAERDGPTILVTGGLHGDEMNGVEIVRRFLFKKYSKPERGMIISIPVMNVFSFLNSKRHFADGRDLNRCFPGSVGGSLASQMAYAITKNIVPHVDYAIDMHAGGAFRFNHPQIRCYEGEQQSVELAKAFNAPFTLLKNKIQEKTFRHTLNERGVPSILFEGGRSLTIENDVVESGLNGILNVLAHLGIRERKETFLDETETVILRRSKWIRAEFSGMFEPVVKNGQFVKEGQLLGYINGPFAQFHRRIKSSVSGYVFCVNLAPVVHLGDALFHIGQEK